MNVKLLQCGNEVVCGMAAATCVRSDNPEKSLKVAIKAGHESILEHWTATFMIQGISRVTLAQLTRHRIASYSVESQRYCDYANAGVICPESIMESECYDQFAALSEEAKELYEKMVACGIPREDARYVLPEGTGTKLVVTMNARELRHFFTLRCCGRAQWEIRELADKMLAICREMAPTIFKDAGPECKRTKCKEVHPCGKQKKA